MEGLGSLLFFAIAFFLMMRFGCGSHMMHWHWSHSHSKTDSDGDDNKNGKYIDPVCGMEVETEQGYGEMFNSTLYRFCSRECLDKFDADPEWFLNNGPLTREEKHNDH